MIRVRGPGWNGLLCVKKLRTTSDLERQLNNYKCTFQTGSPFDFKSRVNVHCVELLCPGTKDQGKTLGNEQSLTSVGVNQASGRVLFCFVAGEGGGLFVPCANARVVRAAAVAMQ